MCKWGNTLRGHLVPAVVVCKDVVLASGVGFDRRLDRSLAKSPVGIRLGDAFSEESEVCVARG